MLKLFQRVGELLDRMQTEELCLLARSFSKIHSQYLLSVLKENGLPSVLRKIISKI